jgi:hypothetical protein|mmetsp:Transcript_57216/g.94789  ORF Transcript_57216/g.94789 Transcript_57216/m.94789 type:complete len:94 (+) Transcript_57216:156-437(+)
MQKGTAKEQQLKKRVPEKRRDQRRVMAQTRTQYSLRQGCISSLQKPPNARPQPRPVADPDFVLQTNPQTSDLNKYCAVATRGALNADEGWHDT